MTEVLQALMPVIAFASGALGTWALVAYMRHLQRKENHRD